MSMTVDDTLPPPLFPHGTRIRCAGTYSGSSCFLYGELMGQKGSVLYLPGDQEEIERDGLKELVTYGCSAPSRQPMRWIQWEKPDIRPCWVEITYLVEEGTPVQSLSRTLIQEQIKQSGSYRLPEGFLIEKTRSVYWQGMYAIYPSHGGFIPLVP